MAEAVARWRESSWASTVRGEDKKDSVTDGGLIADFLDGRPIDPQKYLREFRLNGSICFGNIRTIVEAQGRLHIRIGDALRLDGLVRPIFPWLAYYREDGGYVAAAPDDFVAAFEGTDWDAEEARVRRLQTAFYWLAIAVNYRGAILWDEAISALAERFPDVDFDEAVELVRRRIDASSLIMRLAIVDGMTYLVADDLFDPESDDIMISEVRQILEAQKHIDPYGLTKARRCALSSARRSRSDLRCRSS